MDIMSGTLVVTGADFENTHLQVITAANTSAWGDKDSWNI